MRIDQDLGQALERFVEDEIASGRYGTAGDVIRAALELLREQNEDPLVAWDVEELRREIRKGVDSGPGIPADEVFSRLKAKYRNMAAQDAAE